MSILVAVDNNNAIEVQSETLVLGTGGGGAVNDVRIDGVSMVTGDTANLSTSSIVKTGITSNSSSLNSAEKSAAQEWIGCEEFTFTMADGTVITKRIVAH